MLGYFLQGFNQGFFGGFDLIAKVMELKWRNEELQSRKKKIEELLMAIKNFGDKVESYFGIQRDETGSIISSEFLQPSPFQGRELSFSEEPEAAPPNLFAPRDMVREFREGYSLPAFNLTPSAARPTTEGETPFASRFTELRGEEAPGTLATSVAAPATSGQIEQPSALGYRSILETPEFMRMMAAAFGISEAAANVVLQWGKAIEEGKREEAEWWRNYVDQVMRFISNVDPALLSQKSSEEILEFFKQVFPGPVYQAIAPLLAAQLNLVDREYARKAQIASMAQTQTGAGVLYQLGLTPEAATTTPEHRLFLDLRESYKRGEISFEDYLNRSFELLGKTKTKGELEEKLKTIDILEQKYGIKLSPGIIVAYLTGVKTPEGKEKGFSMSDLTAALKIKESIAANMPTLEEVPLEEKDRVNLQNYTKWLEVRKTIEATAGREIADFIEKAMVMEGYFVPPGEKGGLLGLEEQEAKRSKPSGFWSRLKSLFGLGRREQQEEEPQGGSQEEDLSKLSDEELLRRAANGDSKAYQELKRRGVM